MRQTPPIAGRAGRAMSPMHHRNHEDRGQGVGAPGGGVGEDEVEEQAVWGGGKEGESHGRRRSRDEGEIGEGRRGTRKEHLRKHRSRQRQQQQQQWQKQRRRPQEKQIPEPSHTKPKRHGRTSRRNQRALALVFHLSFRRQHRRRSCDGGSFRRLRRQSQPQSQSQSQSRSNKPEDSHQPEDIARRLAKTFLLRHPSHPHFQIHRLLLRLPRLFRIPPVPRRSKTIPRKNRPSLPNPPPLLLPRRNPRAHRPSRNRRRGLRATIGQRLDLCHAQIEGTVRSRCQFDVYGQSEGGHQEFSVDELGQVREVAGRGEDAGGERERE
mmetsp:Transcript_20907/g.42883  ORF Transcript_20907/g.42883 Transcript_20907/m.42883 type:complete len:323 (+) Transcript_20907:421-1389(+)